MDGRIKRVHISRAQFARPHGAGHPTILSVFVPARLTKDGIRGGRCTRHARSGRPMGSRIVDGLGCRLWTPISRETWTAKGAADIGRPPNRAWKRDVADHRALIGRPTWTGVVARHGRGWAAVVGLSGRPHWTSVAVRSGRRWTLIGRPSWTGVGCRSGLIWPSTLDERGRPYWTGLAAHVGRVWATDMGQLWAATYTRIGHPRKALCGRPPMRDLDGHLEWRWAQMDARKIGRPHTHNDTRPRTRSLTNFNLLRS